MAEVHFGSTFEVGPAAWRDDDEGKWAAVLRETRCTEPVRRAGAGDGEPRKRSDTPPGTYGSREK